MSSAASAEPKTKRALFVTDAQSLSRSFLTPESLSHLSTDRVRSDDCVPNELQPPPQLTPAKISTVDVHVCTPDLSLPVFVQITLRFDVLFLPRVGLPPLPGGVGLVTKNILVVIKWCFDCEITL
jgi:hypothetical protein